MYMTSNKMFFWPLSLFLLIGCAAARDQLRVGAFNVQTFGLSKLGNDEVMNYIVQLVLRYDVILIQEIRDASGVVITSLLERLREEGASYDVVASDRLGRSSYKEQYAYYYRTDKVQLTGAYQFDDGPDDGNDAFSREPFAVRFASSILELPEFAMIGVHTAPSAAVQEVDEMTLVYEAVKQAWDLEDIVLLGDFNSDCSYVTANDWAHISLRNDNRFTWLIDDEADTTVSSTDCAYDRIVTAGERLHNAYEQNSAKAYRFDEEFGLSFTEAKAISDHYPVELVLSSHTHHINDATKQLNALHF